MTQKRTKLEKLLKAHEEASPKHTCEWMIERNDRFYRKAYKMVPKMLNVIEELEQLAYSVSLMTGQRAREIITEELK